MTSTTSLPRRVRIAALGTTAALAAGLTLAIAEPALAAAPITTPDAYAVTKDTVLGVGDPGVFVNDVDPDGDSLAFHSVAAPAGGALAGEELAVTAGGGFTYTPPTGFTGTRTWQYRVESGPDVSDFTDIVFTITAPAAPGNVAPVGGADAYSVAAGGWLNVPAPGVLANDADADGDALELVAQGVDGGALAGEAMTTWPTGQLAYVRPPDTRARAPGGTR